MPIAGSDRLHTHVEYTRKHTTRCQYDSSRRSNVCLIRLLDTVGGDITSMLRQHQESIEHSACEFWEKPATRHICINVT